MKTTDQKIIESILKLIDAGSALAIDLLDTFAPLFDEERLPDLTVKAIANAEMRRALEARIFNTQAA